jgi:hypothetical protein
MGQVFLTVYDNKGRPVAAKTLVDAAGNDVINPRTGQPLIVPRDYDINAAIEFGRSLKDLPRVRFTENPAGPDSAGKYEAMRNAFHHGGPQDLQRSYNGMTGGGGDEFVPAFQHAASFNLGVIGRAAGLSPDEIVLGGGAFNLSNRFGNDKLDTSGPFFNNPDNFRMIQEGIQGHDSDRFLKRTPSNEQFNKAVQPMATQGSVTQPSSADQEHVPGPAPASGQGQQNSREFPGGDRQQAVRQFTTAGQPVGLAQVPPGYGLPQRVIDAGNTLRTNGYEITPRTMYLTHVLGAQGAVDLMKRTGSTGGPPEVPSPDAATGDQMRAWVRALRLGPAAARIAPMAPAASPTPAVPDQSNVGAFDPTQSPA